MTARDVAGPQASPGEVQFTLFLHTVWASRHIRMGPIGPPTLSTHLSVLLTGWRQRLAGGSVQVLAWRAQVLATAVQVLSVLLTQVSSGRLQRLSVPTHVCPA